MKTIVKNEYLFLSILLIFGFVVRLYKIDNPVADWHSWRQADTSAVSRNYVKDGINLFYPTYDDISSIQTGIDNPTGIRMVEFPVFNALHALLYNAMPFFSLEKWGRLMTVFISLVTSIFLFLLGRKHYSSKIGLLTAFFFLFLPFNIYFSRVILPDPLGVLFAVSGLYFFGLNNIISAILFALALLQKPYLGIYLLPLIPELLKKDRFKKNLVFLLSIILPFVLWRFWTGLHPEGIPFYKWAFNGDKIRFHPSWFRWLFGERIGILILGTWGLIPFSFGIIRKLKNNFNLLLALSMLAYLIIVATANVRHDYYQILIIPSIAMTLAIGTVYLWKKNKIILVLSLLVMFLVSWDKIKPFYQINHPELMVVGKIVDETLPKTAKIVIPYNGDTAFLYQTNRKGWPAVDDSIDNIIGRGADYYVSINLGSADSVNFSKRFETVSKTDQYLILDLHKEIIEK
ncbi:MAG: phospholipid carrier-dependent glycosyltransferase [Candidatus Woesebacteria bacterium]|nr:phospholipid carrier-dependent glycosyltransferase [Candidatus Woesebacteria bacterium]